MKYLHYMVNGLRPVNFYYLSSLTIKHFMKSYYNAHSNKTHIAATMGWLKYSQDINKDGGVSAFYSLFDGWADSYIETTGYIISTFFNFSEIVDDRSYRDRAISMAQFELKHQLNDGGFEGGRGSKKPVTFNTGQVIFGLCRTYKETKLLKYLKASKNAADLLVSSMDKNGCFTKNLYLGNIHTYNTRTAWSLLKVHEVTKDQKYKKAAQKNFDWALTQQLENGFFLKNSFYPKQEPLVHTIAYSIRGLLEGYIYLNQKKYLESASAAAKSIIRKQRKDGSLPGSFDSSWNSSVKWSCLTGMAQMSIIWLKLFKITGNEDFLKAAKKSNIYLKRTQDINSKNPGIRGGILGAYPIYGWYAPFSYINWGAKFFVDSLMLEENLEMSEKIDS
jgi:hypothetical protein